MKQADFWQDRCESYKLHQITRIAGPNVQREISNISAFVKLSTTIASSRFQRFSSSESARNKTYISRIREDKTKKNTLNLWIVSDNLLRGAALNAVEIAELLIKKNNEK